MNQETETQPPSGTQTDTLVGWETVLRFGNVGFRVLLECQVVYVPTVHVGLEFSVHSWQAPNKNLIITC